MRWIIPAFALLVSGCNTFEDAFANNPDNPGPCPSALTLRDAQRVVELADDSNTFAAVGFTGEINSVRSLCRYFDDRPINANLEIDFGFGRGPAAVGSEHTFTYFVAVTRRDNVVIHRQDFPIRVRFEPGEDRVFLTERMSEIIIPRATNNTSGTNFEIIVGFDLTDEQILWNRSGQRFQVDAGRPDQ
ncbi:hypothetical protein [Hyphobacterium sp.]|uniref:hypothetical protein n=1 Tax=Hyphobacterium sp. TaxID=2004662 RepID=UPI003BAD6A16